MKTTNGNSAPRHRAGTVLVVDDDPVIRSLEAEMLKHEGYTVLQAEGPTEAMNLGRRNTVDLLVTDFMMPETNGLNLARRFRAEHPGTPVLLVSGSLPDIMGEANRWEHFDVLAKPFHFSDLVLKVHWMLG